MWSRPSLLLAFAAAALAAPPLPAAVRAGDAFPPLRAADLSGTLPETRGAVVLVDFWASWCAPCRASFPAYTRLNADYGTRGLVVLAVSVDQSAEAYARFVQRFHPTFATALDRSQRLVQAVDVPTMPSSYLIGRDGKVRYVHAGFYGERTERELRAEIEALLAEKGPAS